MGEKKINKREDKEKNLRKKCKLISWLIYQQNDR